MTARTISKGDRVVWRGKAGTVVDDYWKDRDRFAVLFDGSSEPLEFGASALMLIGEADAPEAPAQGNQP